MIHGIGLFYINMFTLIKIDEKCYLSRSYIVDLEKKHSNSKAI